MRHWIPKERLKQAKIIKNWQPWKQSTGAKTAAGKARSSQNTYKHGHGISKLQKEVRRLLREQRKLLP